MALHSHFSVVHLLAIAASLVGVGRLPADVTSEGDFPRAPDSGAEYSPASVDEEDRKKVIALRAEIARQDELYFKKAAPVISDAAYDKLKQELARLEPVVPDAESSDGISLAAEDDRSGFFPTHRHMQPMLSLNKCHTESELRAFVGRVSRELGRDDLGYVIEPKYDGVAISVVFEKGKLVRAVTRGDGREGDDVTNNVMNIDSLPHQLRAGSDGVSSNPIPDLIELRGEIYFSFEEFDRINQEQEGSGAMTFANPRNLAAGTLKSLDPAEVARRRLEIVFYGLGECLPATARPEGQEQLHALIVQWGLPGVGKYQTAQTADEVWAAVRAVGEERPRLPFPIDGAVVKLNSAAQQRRLGASAQAPNWAIAFKFVPEAVETKVKAIVIQIGRTGVLSPVAVFAPVQLAGSTVSRASLHNREEIARKDIRVGDFVSVEKAGEIIPVISSVNLNRRTSEVKVFVFPDLCPACGTKVVQAPGEAAVRCPNYQCGAQLRRRLEYFASRAAVGVAGLGPATVNRLVELAGVKNVADLYHLRRDELVVSGATTENSADRLLASLQRSRQAELWRFINGLGIPQIGPATSRQLAHHFSDLRQLLNASEEQLRTAVSSSAASSVTAFLRQKENYAMVDDLASSLLDE